MIPISSWSCGRCEDRVPEFVLRSILKNIWFYFEIWHVFNSFSLLEFLEPDLHRLSACFPFGVRMWYESCTRVTNGAGGYLKYHMVEQWCNTPIFAVVIEFQPNSHSFVGDYRLWTRASMKTTSAISTHVLVLLWPFLILMLKMLKNLRSKSVTTLFFLDIWGERDQLYWHIQQRR